ncbi:sulfite exporter TauE/SafE family protein [Streptomyces sp. DSM 41014]|uniref:Probable membrane transporter protein n=1 Tax=Streptomyces hintoniae TaxID=3075521 RepID=A0ABU2UNT6_9ACTN|nr:sulfite exporter TauE/SafE family protein [Streptomyces sp. DSM 41014]MDT0474492.1 sulfite exporter TauE/SafE family protein [Streptomyces sp. DSM 41014]
MDVLALLGIGVLTGLTTVLFGFGGGFVAVPVVVWADGALGTDAMRVATATSAAVMVVNAGFATAVTPRPTLAALRGGRPLLALLAVGGALGALAARLAPSGPVRWAFTAYVALTLADLLLRPGFLKPQAPADSAGSPGSDSTPGTPGSPGGAGLPAVLGAPIGAVAAFLGVGGSVLTVPAMRRAGHTMRTATTLANPLTLALALPAAAVSLLGHTAPVAARAGVPLVGTVDPRAAGALLLGALPVIAVLRRRPPRIGDRTHAWAYATLLAVVIAAMLALDA